MTYYALLSAGVVRRWVEATHDDFQFVVKAHPVFTGHPIDRNRLPAELAAAIAELKGGTKIYPTDLPPEVRREIEWRYFEALVPLVEQRRLCSIVVQFPPWFDATRGNEQLANEAETVRAIFSSCIRDYAVLGAKGLCTMMQPA